jgi:hypothetical protein
MRRKLVFMIPMGIAAIALFAFIGGEVVKLLWNWLMPALFGLPVLSFWQALGLLALSRILVGGHGLSRSRSRRYTPEEKQRFRRVMRDRFGFGSPSESRPNDPGLHSQTEI